MRAGAIMEIRGIVNKDTTISYGEFTQYDPEFDLATYETMLVYYHGMCRDLCLKWSLINRQINSYKNSDQIDLKNMYINSSIQFISSSDVMMV